MGMAFLIAAALTAIVLSIFGAESRGTILALQATARWSFVLFWPAYAGSSIAAFCGSYLKGLTRRGREFGLAFASAQLVHIGLVAWLFHISAGPEDAMTFFWIGTICTYLLALLSFAPFRNVVAPRFWRAIRLIALEYIALVFAADFILDPLQSKGLRGYPQSYLPFALMLVVGAVFRVTALIRHDRQDWTPRPTPQPGK
jgi:hypothetical protein